MRKKVFGRKFSRDRGARTALFRSLVKALVERGKIVTTKAKAKAIQPLIDHLVSVSKTKDVAVIRRVLSKLGNDQNTVNSLFNEVSNSFKSRKSGFTRIVNLPRRKGDNAEVVRLEWTEKIEVVKAAKAKKESKKPKLEVEGNKDSLKSKVTKLLKSKKR